MNDLPAAEAGRLRPVALERSHDDVAQALGNPSVDVARLDVGRALVRVVEEMKRGDA
jgi:hypothetical protein